MEQDKNIGIFQAIKKDHYNLAQQLIKAYMHFLGEDLTFQKIEAELETLPKMYGDENGCLLLAEKEGEVIGMVAIRRKSDTICEMKRLFVLPTSAGLGVGKKLAIAIIKKAKEIGFEEMVLDTLQRLTPALQLYKSLGFEEVAAYYENPLPEVVYMRLKLL